MLTWHWLEIIPTFLGTCCMALGIWVWTGSPRSPRLKNTFAVFTISASLWIFSVVIADLSTNLRTLAIFTKLATLFSGLGLVSFFNFALLFRYEKIPNSKLLWSYAPLIALIIFIISFPENKVYVSNPFEYQIEGRPVGGALSNSYALYIPGILLYMLAGVVVLLYKHRQLPARIKQQIYYIVAGAVVTIAAGLLFDAILPIFKIDYLYSFGTSFTSVLVFCSAYAIIKHQLLDIRVFIQRSLIYSLLLGIIVALYITTLFILSGFIITTANFNSIMSGISTAIIAIFGVPPLEKYFRKVSDPLFHKNYYDYPTALRKLSSSLNNNLQVKDIVSAVFAEMREVFKLNQLSLLLKENKRLINNGNDAKIGFQDFAQAILELFEDKSLPKQTIFYSEEIEQKIPPEIVPSFKVLLDIYDFKVWIRIETNNQLIGVMALGSKQSGDHYNKQDEHLLITFSHQAAVAIEKSILYERLQNRAQELEQAVRERTQELENMREVQSQMMIDISHSLQSPLTVMKSQLDNLRQKANVEESSLFNLDNGLDEVSRRIYDLLRLAKMEAMKEYYNLECLDLSELANEIAEYVHLTCSQQNIKFRAEITPGVFVNGDKQKLEELINNLISNSIKFIANSKTITLVLKTVDRFAEISIEDTGIGIKSEDLNKIFERFYRSSGNNGISGMGVGLAICKSIVAAHQGSIRAKSKVGVGSKFYIKIPLTEAKEVVKSA